MFRGVAFASDALFTDGPVGLFHWPIIIRDKPRRYGRSARRGS
jgi:hypothetical protein